MATCIETYMQTVSAADQLRDNTIALCGSQQCITDAIIAHSQAVQNAVAAYEACVASSGGGGTDD